MHTPRIKVFTNISLFFSLVIGLILTSCVESSPIIDSDKKISFQVDSFRVYDASNISMNKFMFSPILDVDKIWTINTPNPYELDLKTGVWAPLKEKFGEPFRKQIREDKIWQDPFSDDIYIACGQAGLLRYNKLSDTKTLIEIKHVSACLPNKDNVVLGSPDGLFLYNRRESQLKSADNFPINQRVNYLENGGGDTILINNNAYYLLESSTLVETSIRRQRPEIKRNYKSVSVETRRKFGGLNGGFKQYSRDTILWFYKDDILNYSLDGISYQKFLKFPKGHIRHLIEDDDHLYILFNEAFVIFIKEYIFENSGFHNAKQYEALKAELHAERDSFYNREISIEEYIDRSVALYKKDAYSSFQDLQDIIDRLPETMEYYDYNHKEDHVEKILQQENLPDEYRFFILKGLARKNTMEGRLSKAHQYLDQLVTNFPNVDDYCIQNTHPCIERSKKALDSIKYENSPADVLLYKEALVLEKMIQCSCWFGESYSDFSLVIKQYKELLRKYPTSNYADDASFWLLQNQYLLYDEELSPNAIPAFNKFIKQYPSSEYNPELLMAVANSYAFSYAEDSDIRIQNIKKAIEQIEYIERNFVMDSIMSNKVEQNKATFIHDFNKLVFDLSISSSKSKYRLGEEIKVTCVLKNNRNTPAEVKIFDRNSHFSFHVTKEGEVGFMPFETSELTQKVFISTKGNPLTQDVVLNKLARHWDGGQEGVFEFKEPGFYYITCFSRLSNLRSKQIKILIEND